MIDPDHRTLPITMTPLTPIELATNKVYGQDPAVPPLPRVPDDLTALEALESVVLPAVARPPCVVTFSGGRDSSLVLAAATRVARREGLPDPVPATIRFVDIEGAEESEWQELVVRHLGLDEWVSRDIRTDLDFIGPLASSVLLRHGVLWPLNIYLHESLISHARGGSIMTGMHGDAVFGGGRWLNVNELLGGRRRFRVRDTLRVGLAVSPRVVKRRIMKRRLHVPPWLTRIGREAFIEAKTRSESGAPRRWDQWMDNLARRRSVRVAGESMEKLADDADALLVQPLGSPLVLATLAHQGGTRGIGNRTSLMRSLFTELLPDELLARGDKAVFGDAFIGRWTEEFVRDWQGDGVDTEWVDPEVLKEAWTPENFDFRSSLLLQAAWLSQQT
jgi:hypothetical protein